MFAVVVCPKCGAPKMLSYPFKTTKCYRCGHAMNLKTVVYTANDIEEARKFLAKLKMKGKTPKFTFERLSDRLNSNK
jgi:ribosomal protein L40E